MNPLDLNEITKRSLDIRERYHELEQQFHGSEWTVTEDALAFLTDAGLVGRHAMSQQGRWPKENTQGELQHKIGECIWWLAVLSSRMEIDLDEAVREFLAKTEKMLDK
ncbi:MAG: MazG-like protein [Flavobacterium sp.]|uniref:MazG-like protein n=1 Tax=Flavobacterium sp. TaxID=239 RepID=UPI00120015B2|nr:MazG-like protein [Flavobacterium sp.]RZJ65456.1 MAG: MazG-like protein [Flavobacterium sp.]